VFSTINCEKCGPIEVEAASFEDLRDAIAEHLMLVHGITKWKEENLPEEYDDRD